MGMSMSCAMSQRIETKQTLEIKLEQKAKMLARLLALKMELISVIHGEKYETKAHCPQCSRKLSGVEIISGFNQNPKDFTTRCTGCNHRFEPSLVCLDDNSSIEIKFYCSAQVLYQLRGLQDLTTDELARKHAGIYRSAIVHHGSIRSAFKMIGVEYQFEEFTNWENKITPFLGLLPDKMIADCVNVSPYVVRKLRSQLGVVGYSKAKMIQSI